LTRHQLILLDSPIVYGPSGLLLVSVCSYCRMVIRKDGTPTTTPYTDTIPRNSRPSHGICKECIKAGEFEKETA